MQDRAKCADLICVHEMSVVFGGQTLQYISAMSQTSVVAVQLFQQ